MMQEAIRLPPLSDDADPTAQQQRASDPRLSIWVNASAGSGKTTILTKRVMRLLLDGVKPERILCLTFTRAAAAEMAIRVTAKLSEWVTCSDNELSHSLGALQGHAPSDRQMIEARRLFARALACPGGLRLRTIHAFGQELLRRFPLESGLPPHFAVIEEADARLLQEEVLLTLLRDAPNNGLGDDLQLLVTELGETGFVGAMRDILRERERLAAAGSCEEVVASMRALLGLEPGATADSLLADALGPAVLPEDALRDAARQLLEGTPSFVTCGETLLRWLEREPAARVESFADYTSIFLTKDGEPRKKFANKDLLAKYPALDIVLRDEAARLQKLDERMEAARIAAVTAAVLRLGSETIRRYQARKIAQAALDYDDLIARANALLTRPDIAPWVLFKLDGGLDHILVDEAQDTSRAQWEIVRVLADEFFAGRGAKDDDDRTLFVVGDEKQSIFSFQNADPAAFAEMKSFFRQRITGAEKPYDEIPLSVSFRSAPAVLRAVDTVFAHANARAGVSIAPVRHQSFGRDKYGRVEVWELLEASAATEADGATAWDVPLAYEDERDPQAELAERIARQIRGWLDRKEVLPGTSAPVVPGDVMILLRKRGRFADLMVRALKRNAVPVTGVDRMRLIEQIAVMDLLALAQFALLPEDDLNLATVLRGPLLNVSENDLMTLALGRAGSLWQSLCSHHAAPPFAAAHDYLSRWLGKADFMTPFAMLARLLNEPCPGSAVSGRQALWARLGLDALDPVEELLNAAQNFSRRHAPSLQRFLQWLTMDNREIKREMDAGGGQVRIMTVHASKGLEAPIVFLPDTAETPRAQDVPKFLWSADNLPLYLPRKPSTGVAARLWGAARERQMEEYRRLLYVALTRAANRLYIGGWKGKRATNGEGSWHDLVRAALQPLHEPAIVDADPAQDPPPLIALADPELRTRPAEAARVSSPPPPPLPDWARVPAVPERMTTESIAPSQLGEPPATATPDDAFARGRLIHRLLQSLPDMPPAHRDQAAARFLANPQHRLTAAQQADIQTEVMNLLRHPQFAPLFGPDSQAEVPLAGLIDGRKMAGQVDRLCLHGDEVWIVDYKTNRPPPTRAADTPPPYILQMESYRALLRAIYPGKTIRGFLLWTYAPRLMELLPPA